MIYFTILSNLIAGVQINNVKTKTKNKRKNNSHVSLIYEESNVSEDIDSHEDCQFNGAARADTTSGDSETFRH